MEVKLQAFFGAEIDMNRANEVHPVFRKLGDIAQSTGCAIMMIGHLNKASGAEHTETKLEQAERLILSILESRGTCASSDIDKAAQGLGISPRTVRSAKQHLSGRLHSERIGTQWMLSLRQGEPENDLINWQDSIDP